MVEDTVAAPPVLPTVKDSEAGVAAEEMVLGEIAIAEIL